MGSIVPTSNIGTGGATPAPPTPITYLTQWKIVGNSEVHDNEIWSCGEYNATDGKYHIIVQPLGGNIADIALTEPLRKVNDVADTIEFPSDTEGKALVTRNLSNVDLGKTRPTSMTTYTSGYNRWRLNDVPVNMKRASSADVAPNILCATFVIVGPGVTYNRPANPSISVGVSDNVFLLYSDSFAQLSANEVKAALDGVIVIVELATPTTELVDAPKIAEAESYSCVISQGGKAVEWSSFITDSE